MRQVIDVKKEIALELLDKFPELSEKVKTDMRRKLKPYLIVDKKTGRCRCTYCEREVEHPWGTHHRDVTVCPNCGESVTLIENWHNFSGVVVESETNCSVFLSSENPDDNNLYVRCFNLRLSFAFHEIEPIVSILETQRYVFTNSSVVRYGKDKVWYREAIAPGRYINGYKWSDWIVRTRVTEPVFNSYCYGSYANHNYWSINIGCVENTCMKYSAVDRISGVLPIEYLIFYRKHTGIERLVKLGLHELVREEVYLYGSSVVDYTQAEPHKMLGISRAALKAVRERRIELRAIKALENKFPYANAQTLITYDSVIRSSYDELENVSKFTGAKNDKIVRYLISQREKNGSIVNVKYFSDYLNMCERLNYDMHDKAVLFPRDLIAAHDRAASAEMVILAQKERQRNALRDEKMKLYQKERGLLEFRHGDLIAILPKSCADIVVEGAVLGHCVGGYAQRHADYALTIMFLRRANDPDTPYYTIEVSNEYKIVQCRGYHNNVPSRGGKEKPLEITEFEKVYQEYLLTIKEKAGKRARQRVKISA